MIPTIHSKTLATIDLNVQMNDDTKGFELDSSHVHVWSIEFPKHFHELFKTYRYLIGRDEFDRAKRLYRADDFKRYLTGRIILRILLGRYLALHPSEILFGSNNGKLYSLNSPLKFNLSYSHKHIFMSFGHCETGIDIELIKHDFALRDILESCFSPLEIANIDRNAKTSTDSFFLQWTRKEALLKYTGQGIIDDLTIIPSMDGLHDAVSSKLKISSNLNLISFNPHYGLVGSLAYPTSITNVEFLKWQS